MTLSSLDTIRRSLEYNRKLAQRRA